MTNTVTSAELTWQPLETERKTGKVFLGKFDNGEVIACKFMDNSHTKWPWTAYRTMYGVETIGRKLIEWMPMPPAAPEPTVQEAKAEILKHTFASQYNPNCPSPWLVRLIGKNAAFIDLKPYSAITAKEDFTGDILGFGKTFEEAALRALAEQGEA